jgi:hypothetical protein
MNWFLIALSLDIVLIDIVWLSNYTVVFLNLSINLRVPFKFILLFLTESVV